MLSLLKGQPGGTHLLRARAFRHRGGEGGGGVGGGGRRKDCESDLMTSGFGSQDHGLVEIRPLNNNHMFVPQKSARSKSEVAL